MKRLLAMFRRKDAAAEVADDTTFSARISKLINRGYFDEAIGRAVTRILRKRRKP